MSSTEKGQEDGTPGGAQDLGHDGAKAAAAGGGDSAAPRRDPADEAVQAGDQARDQARDPEPGRTDGPAQAPATRTATLTVNTGKSAPNPKSPLNDDISRNGVKASTADTAGAATAQSPAADAQSPPVEKGGSPDTARAGRDVPGGSTGAGVSDSASGDTKTMPAASTRQGGPPGRGPGGDSGGRGGGGGGGGNGKGPKKQRSRRVRYLRRILFTLLGILGFFVAAFAIAYVFTPVPSPQEQALAQGPAFYYSDGKTLIAKTGMNRDAVTLDRIPKSTRDAVIAAENRSFYQDPGVSIQGTARAFWSTATGEQLQGGSTITQQMVRNYYGGIGKERSVTRKLKEVMVSLKVGREKSKGWILEQYLNTIYFGRDAYGVQAAAHAYYGKDAKDLTPAESAYLAAAIQQPSNFADPTGQHRVYAEQRWRAVVNNMVRDGALSPADAAAMKFPLPGKEKITDVLKGQKGYMVNLAKKELEERRGYTEDEINRSGLKITTTFDRRLMDAAKRAVDANTPDGMSKKIRTGLVSVDPATGQVLAFYGGRDYLTEAASSAFYDTAQVGSGFKPIALAAALEDGKTLSDTYDGSSPQYFGGHRIENDSGENFGNINLVTATEHSVNTAYVNLGQDIGNDKIAEMAEKLGVSSSQMTAAQRSAASFPLGIVSLHPVQQAGVYATFADEGQFRKPYVVKSVTDNEGQTRKFAEKGQRAFSTQVARDATYAMQQVVQGGTGTGAQLPDGRDVAGKTGTTDEGRAIWFNGFIPQMATTVTMFREDNKALNIPGYGAYGGQLPTQMWRSYMTDAVDIKGYDPESFGSPSETPGGGWDGPPTGGGQTTEPPRTEGPSHRPSGGTDEPRGPKPSTGLPTIIPSLPGGGDGGGNGGGGNDGGGNGGGGGNDGGGNDGGGGGGTGDGGGGGQMFN
ncbi:transglycosylase domain-containing protein [Actinomadura opuntiae]|uniref:transglycosylase domain-containing protein n=1 Tax=Actinomadura sp. OS1-43 TaxID=604315 RepID=UPI00255AAF45|nr:transglycosylase domain-containing protein [Actinomadura sp. OS1-43]MDL4817767.1 transglycosylase domain-containing protein [Actinomadura sp. OS1-43]